MKKYIQMVVVLFAISALSGLIMGWVNGVTAPIIEKRQNEAAMGSMREIFADMDGFEDITSANEDKLANYPTIRKVTSIKKDGQVIGYFFEVTTTGYKAGLNLLIGVESDGTIKAIKAGSHGETAGFGKDKLENPAFLGQYTDLEDPGTINMGSDLNTGATLTAGAVNEAAKKTRELAIVLGGGEAPVDHAETAVVTIYGDNAVLKEVSFTEAQYVTKVYMALDENSNFLGYMFRLDVTEIAFNGKALETFIGLDQNGAIKNVAYGEFGQTITPSYGGKVLEEAFISKLIGKTSIDQVANEDGDHFNSEIVDTVSGATYTRNAMFAAVKTVFEVYDAQFNNLDTAVETNFSSAHTFTALEEFEQTSHLFNVYTVKDAEGAVAGYVFHMEGQGHYSESKNGILEIFVSLDANGAVKGLNFGRVDETGADKAFWGGALVQNPDFLAEFVGKTSTISEGSIGVDIETGATSTMKSVVGAVNAALEYYTENLSE